MHYDVKVVVDGKVTEIGSIIPEHYSLVKLWVDIRNICWDEPIRHATSIRAQLLLPRESDGRELFSDSDMRQRVKELKEKRYRWARLKMTSYMR